jgi:hypothetical protein
MAVIIAETFYGEKLQGPWPISWLHLREREYCMIGYSLSNTLSPYGSVSRGVCMSDEKGIT